MHPRLCIRRKSIQILPTQQPKRILIHKPIRLRLIIPDEVVMQSDLFIEVLVLQSERLMRILVNPFILFQTAPGVVFAEPQELAVLIGHLTWDDRFGRSGSSGFVGGFRRLR